jgi:hypothetical protein
MVAKAKEVVAKGKGGAKNGTGTKKDEPKVHQGVSGILPIDEACTDRGIDFDKKIYGACDENSDDCKECKTGFPSSYRACLHNTKLMKAGKTPKAEAKAAPKETPKAVPKAAPKAAPKKEPAVKVAVEKTIFGHRVVTGAGKMDVMLLRKEGASMDELKASGGAAVNHLAHLKRDHGDIITITRKEDGRYYGKLNKA